MTERCHLCSHGILPHDGMVRGPSGWVAHLLCVARLARERRGGGDFIQERRP